MIYEIEEENDIVKGCKGFFEDISYREFYPVVFRVMTLDGIVLWESENFSTILSKGIKGKRTLYRNRRLPGEITATAFMKKGSALKIRDHL